jgi:hypothetical protein
MIRISLVRPVAAAAFGLLLGLAPIGLSSASAQSGDSPEARQACTGDALSLCGQCNEVNCYRACLVRQRRPQISAACYSFIHRGHAVRHLRRRA